MAGCVIARNPRAGHRSTGRCRNDQRDGREHGCAGEPVLEGLLRNGLGYLDAQRVNDDSKIACVNRKAGVPPYQIAPLLESRGYTEHEAWSIVLAEWAAQDSVFSVC